MESPETDRPAAEDPRLRNWWTRVFDQEMGRVLFRPGIEEAAGPQVAFILETARIPVGGRVLDLCCGTGRCLPHLVEAGLEVHGMDLTRAYLRQAANRMDAMGATAGILRGDMSRLPYRPVFDLVINLFTSFGYFPEPERNQAVLREVFRVLRPGGVFFMDLVNRDWIIRHFQPRGWHEYPGGYLLEERSFDPATSRMTNRWIALTASERREYRLSHTIYAPHELRGMLEQVGFQDVRLLGDLDGGPASAETSRLMALARKEGAG